MNYALRFFLVCSALALAACEGAESDPVEQPDAAVSPSPSLVDAGAPTIDAPPEVVKVPSMRDAGLRLDASIDAAARRTANESFETALAIADAGAGLLVDIVHAQQANYFSFEARAGEFYELRTNNHAFSPDVSLTLFDAERRLLASNDDGSLWPGDSVDARLVVRVPHAGLYYVKVVDATTPSGFFNSPGISLLYYRLDVHVLAPGAPGISHRQDGGVSEVKFAIDERSGYAYATAVGDLTASTVDTFSIPGKADHALIGHLLASGASGNGSTAHPAPVRVLDGEHHLLAEIDGSETQLQIFPPIGEGQHELTVRAPATVGDNAFYAVDLVMLPDNPREKLEADNGLPAQAEPIALMGGARRRGLLLSNVPGSDVDYYSFEATQGELVYVFCDGESAGSGVRQLQVELRDGADLPLKRAVESAAHELTIEDFSLAATGRHYLRLSSDRAATTEGALPWVRCVVIVGP